MICLNEIWYLQGNSLKKKAFRLHFSRLPYGRDLRERVGQKQQRGQTSPREEPRWRSASPAWHSYPGQPIKKATALAELWEIEGNNCKQTFLLLDGSMARELNIWHVGPSTALSFISSSTSDLQYSQPQRLPSSQKTESQERIPNKLKYC